ncbi:UNVERIFIED_CONTAM: hypothetical protein Slati_3438000 [Sesamum latifolium]|uniref:Retrotransposon gag domain-containing protein n=1 Tax=Sesamum latifolium TaxID=2727402 RepID=A0AAW2UFA3_9LAMI
MSIEEGHSSQASPPLAPPQRRRGHGEHAERAEKRVEGAASSRRENASRAQNDSQQQGATQNPLPLAVALARKSPFSMQILVEALPQGIRIPSLTEYDGTGDPEDHLEKFLAKADLLDMSDAGYCKIFALLYLEKPWPVIQQEHESLRDYVQRFSEAVLEVPHLNHELLASILQQGLRREALKPKVESNNKRKVREGERKDPRREGLVEGQRHMSPDGFTRYTPLKVPRAEILTVAEQGHSTEDCYHLKNEIEKLIQRGYLKEYIENKPSGHTSAPRREGGEREEAESSRRREKGRENLPTAGVISVVTGGPWR